jgi:uncharacterized membrane-anchored protein
MKYGFVIAFLLLAFIQWLVPVKIIFQKNEVLKKGRSYKFQTEPVDPSNPFKGKYITLNFTASSFTDTIERGLTHNADIYVMLGTDQNGYVFIKSLSTDKPKETIEFVRANVYYTSKEKDSLTVFIRYPFNEFYMDEYKAPKAEIIFRESTGDRPTNTYALVKIWKGEAVIQDVYINDTPIRKLIR